MTQNLTSTESTTAGNDSLRTDEKGATATWTPLKLTVTALLIAIGILIPIISPFKIQMEPASFTLASHVAIFLAVMIDPAIACAVAIGTFMGFFLNFPVVIALRAASHIVFAMVGAYYLKYHPGTLNSLVKSHVFSFFIALIHAACEVGVVFGFYFNGTSGAYTSVKMILLLIGLGSVVHSMVDFEIAYWIYKPLSKQKGFSKLLAR
jgi:niacin transporter